MAEQQEEFKRRVQAGLDLPEERRLYFNGFSIVISPPDIAIVLQNSDVPLVHLNTSHTVAKSLANALNELLDGYAKKSGQEILTLGEIEDRMKNAKDE